MTPLKMMLYLFIAGACAGVIFQYTTFKYTGVPLGILVIASMWFGAVTEKSR